MKSHIILLVFILILKTFIVNAGEKSQNIKVPERGFISSKPANTWVEGLICGNGTIGINMFSRPLEETIIFNHERLFLPMGKPTVPPDNSHRLFEIRNLIDMGLYNQATELAFDLSGQESFMYPDRFVPAFDVNLNMKSSGEISLLPALPAKFATGSVVGVLCRGQVEVKSMSWTKNSVEVSLISAKDQKIKLVLPSVIKTINVKEGVNKIENTGNGNEKMLFLKKGEKLSCTIEI